MSKLDQNRYDEKRNKSEQISSRKQAVCGSHCQAVSEPRAYQPTIGNRRQRRSAGTLGVEGEDKGEN